MEITAFATITESTCCRWQNLIRRSLLVLKGFPGPECLPRSTHVLKKTRYLGDGGPPPGYTAVDEKGEFTMTMVYNRDKPKDFRRTLSSIET
jgi:hypothetical protein